MASLLVLLLVLAAVTAAVPADFSGDKRDDDGVQANKLTPRYNPDTDNQYHLFTRANPTVSQLIIENYEDILQASNYDSSKRTVVLIHGSRASVTSAFNTVLIPAFLNAADVNIIAVDWSVGAYYGLNGIESARTVARVLRWLLWATGSDLANFHFVGHGAGAHQAGLIGKTFAGHVGYITGLDPEFTWFYPDILSSGDAIYTEVIHTNAGDLGFEHPLGDVDFYPNGGNMQPGCVTTLCASDRSFYFMAESLSTGGFMGWECTSYQQALDSECDGERKLEMGGLLPKTGSKGIFYLRTNAGPPFALG